MIVTESGRTLGDESEGQQLRQWLKTHGGSCDICTVEADGAANGK